MYYSIPVIKDGHGNILIAAIARAKQRAALYVLLPGVYCIFRWCTENVNLIGGILTKLQLIGWKKSLRQIHSPPEEELQPEPAVPGVVGAEEDLGGAGEWWECYKVLAHIHGQPSSFFQS